MPRLFAARLSASTVVNMIRPAMMKSEGLQLTSVPNCIARNGISNMQRVMSAARERILVFIQVLI